MAHAGQITTFGNVLPILVHERRTWQSNFHAMCECMHVIKFPQVVRAADRNSKHKSGSVFAWCPGVTFVPDVATGYWDLTRRRARRSDYHIWKIWAMSAGARVGSRIAQWLPWLLQQVCSASSMYCYRGLGEPAAPDKLISLSQSQKAVRAAVHGHNRLLSALLPRQRWRTAQPPPLLLWRQPAHETFFVDGRASLGTSGGRGHGNLGNSKAAQAGSCRLYQNVKVKIKGGVADCSMAAMASAA